MSEWKKELNELSKVMSEKMSELEKRVDSLSKPLTGEPTGENREEPEVPIYRCSGKDCKFTTDDVGAFIEHKIGEEVKPIRDQLARVAEMMPVEEEPRPAKKRHMTPAEHLDCPDCYPKFEAELLKRGWKKPEPKTEKKELEQF